MIEVQEGRVTSVRFQATEFRGFQYLVHAVPAEQMVVIVPRICGVCSTAHHLAAVKTLEEIYGVTPPPLALQIRELLMLGQIIQNQATSLFIFTMPDRLGVASLFQSTGEDTDDAVARTAAQALWVRRVGSQLIALAGGQFIHPIQAVIGGVIHGIEQSEAAPVRDQVLQALPVACRLVDDYWTASLAMSERIGTWGDDAPACYITAVADTRPNYTGDIIRVMCADGCMGPAFPAHAYRDYLDREETEYSYADRTSYGGQVMRANSLARINMTQQMGTPCADDYLDRFRKAFGQPAHALMLFDLSRGIELVYALERAAEILAQPLVGQDTAVPYTPIDGEGYGLVEAPRGPLIHHYRIQDGLIADAEFVIPTIHNVMAIERALRVAAERYVNAERVDLELERAVGRVVRAFDPCIACATH